MPELPEVETVVRGLLHQLVGAEIIGVDVFKPLVLKSMPALFISRVTGQKIQKISRHGKSIFWTLSPTRHVKIHLGMSGALLLHPKEAAVDPYVRVRFRLDNPERDVVFRDVRQFGKVMLTGTPYEEKWGPDMWTSSLDEIFSRLRKKKGMIKHALLNQNVVAGLGNIYVDETLFLARVHPKKNVESLSNQSLRMVCETARNVLAVSIKAGGTSFRDYVNAEGVRGDFKNLLNVYGQESKHCPVCQTPIRKIVVAARGTHFCPRCQPAPRGSARKSKISQPR